MTDKQQDFQQRVDQAIEEFIGGANRATVTAKYGISNATLHRHMRKKGLRLSPEELRVRRHQAGKTTQELHRRRIIRNEPCPYGCTCQKHKPNKNNLKHPIIAGRKNCARCTRWRSILDFFVRDRDANGNPLGWQNICKSCMAEQTRINQGIRRRGRPYEKRKPGLTQEQRREHRRQLHAHKMATDPAYAENRREYARIYAEGKRREAGIPRRDAMIANRKIGGKQNDPKLPIDPFVEWIRERADFYARSECLEAKSGTVIGIGLLANICGIAERSLHRFVSGYEIDKNGKRREICEVPLSTVDECLTNEGTTLIWELYPDEGESDYNADIYSLDLDMDFEMDDDLALVA